VGVSLSVVIVAEALAGAVSEAGLTVHEGPLVKIGDTWQLRFTVPMKPLSAPTVMFADDTPVGGTASGDRGSTAKVKVWADAGDDNVRNAADRQRNAMPAGMVRTWNLDFKGLDFNMSRFRFK